MKDLLSLLNEIPESLLLLLFLSVTLGLLLGVIRLAFRYAGWILLGFIAYTWFLSSAG